MAHNYKKEDDKIEKMIRGLLKLPENRRCINCNSLGPQYVCTTYWTFICTNCSGIHREFTHRVKSISMSKFTIDEVNALLAGGNESASRIYFKIWDPQRHLKPDCSDLYKLRAFIKHVYVDRKFTGERTFDNQISSAKEDSDVYKYESSNPNNGDRYDKYRVRGGGRSKFGATSDEGFLRMCYEEGRSPGYYSLDKSRPGALRRSSTRFEVVDDRVRDDDTRKGNRLPRLMSADFMLGGMSVKVKKKANKANSLEVAYSTRKHCSKKSQKKETSTCNPAATNANLVKSTVVNSKHRDKYSMGIISTNVKPADALTNDGGICDSSTKETVPPKKTMNTLKSLLFELSAPTSVIVESEPAPTSNLHSGTDQTVGHKESTETRAITGNVDSPLTLEDVPIQHLSLEAAPDQSTQNIGIESIGIKEIQQHQDMSLVEQTVSVNTNDQAMSTNVVETAQEMIRVEDTRNMVPSATKELPADLFAALYGPGPTPVRGWNGTPPHSYDFGYTNHMQHSPNQMAYAGYPNATRWKNPFDVADEQAYQGQPYPCAAHIQGGFFNMSAPLSTPGLGGRPLGPQQPLNPPSTPHMPSGTVNPHQEMRYSAPSTVYPPSVGGNPFG